MKQIGYLIETEPQYNALYHEFYPVEKIEKEVELIKKRARMAKEKELDNTNDKSLLTGMPNLAHKPYKRKKI